MGNFADTRGYRTRASRRPLARAMHRSMERTGPLDATPVECNGYTMPTWVEQRRESIKAAAAARAARRDTHAIVPALVGREPGKPLSPKARLYLAHATALALSGGSR